MKRDINAILHFFSWPHKWMRNSKNNFQRAKNWKSSVQHGSGNVWIMLQELSKDFSKYMWRKYIFSILLQSVAQ